jgi:lysophospholipase L1-like esterase
VEVNRDGFRGAPRRLAKPPDVWRVAVLGDSMTEALQVDLAETFPAVLERRLARCPALPPGVRDVEVLNFGVSGYGTAQELLTLRHQALAWAPDLVLLAFYTGNDVRNNLEALERDPGRPYFRLGDDGALTLDDTFRRRGGLAALRGGPAAQWLLAHSRLAQLGKAAVRGAEERRAAEAARRRAPEEPLAELGLDNAVYAPPATAAWREAWRVTEALIAATAAEARSAGADFALVTLTNGIQVHPDPRARRRFAARLGLDDLTYPERRLTSFARRRGIPALALVGPLERLARERGVSLHGFGTAPAGPGTGAPDVGHWNRGHWNAAGHRAAGAAIASWLCRGAAGGATR